MQDIDIPTKLPIPFADTGIKNAIPEASQIGITPGAASLTDGFPPLNFLPVAAGGIPPFGSDMNGILFEISAWIRWLNAGGPIPYDAVFSANIGGYMKGATLLAASGDHWWLSATDNNVTDPDTGGSGWTQIGPFGNIMSLNVGAGLTVVGSDLTTTSSGASNIDYTMAMLLGYTS